MYVFVQWINKSYTYGNSVKLKRSNHSTVIHGVHKIEQDILVDKELEETINVLKKKLNS